MSIRGDLANLYRIPLGGKALIKASAWPLLGCIPAGHPRLAMPTDDWRSRADVLQGDPRMAKYLVERCGVTAEEIEAALASLLANQPHEPLLLRKKVRRIRKYLIEPRLAVAGYDPWTVQIHVTVTDVPTGASGMRLFLETREIEALALTEKFTIKNGCVEALPRTGWCASMLADGYRGRGFRVPVRVAVGEFVADCESALN